MNPSKLLEQDEYQASHSTSLITPWGLHTDVFQMHPNFTLLYALYCHSCIFRYFTYPCVIFEVDLGGTAARRSTDRVRVSGGAFIFAC